MAHEGGTESEIDRIFEEERRSALEETRAWINALPEEERQLPHLSVGGRTFSPNGILKEIEEATEFGHIFIKQLTAQRLEAAKRREEIDAEQDRLEG